MPSLSPDLLAAAVDATRRALTAMDHDEVPAALRKVAAQTGKRLPPPLARRVLTELDESEWLREKAAAQLTDAEHADERHQAAHLFLQRPEGWAEELEALDSGVREQSEESDRRALERRVAALEAELETSKGRIRRAQREAELSQAEAEKRITAARTSARAGRASDQDQIETLERENAALRSQAASLEKDLTETKQRLTRIRAELLRERRTDRPSDAPPPTSVWADLDPIGTARLLDEVSAALAPPGEFEEATLPFESPARALPAGVAPDDAASIDWLLTQPDSFVLLVDGYNVTFQLSPDAFMGATQRARLETDLARLRRLAAGRPRVVVVYDSDQTGGITTESGPGGIERRFTTAGHSADEEILTMATELGAGAVVISSDRRVREGAERVGALGLWSQALVGWATR